MELRTIRGVDTLGNKWSKEVEAVHFYVTGFEFLDLFVYQHDGSYGLGGGGNTIQYFPDKAHGKYLIAERTTGLWCKVIADHPEEAVYKFGEYLHSLGQEICLEVLKKAQQNS